MVLQVTRKWVHIGPLASFLQVKECNCNDGIISLLVHVCVDVCLNAGSESGGHDSTERSRSGVPVCGPRFSTDRSAESGDASSSFQLPLS